MSVLETDADRWVSVQETVVDRRLTARDRQRPGFQAGSLPYCLLSPVVTGRQTDVAQWWPALDQRRDRPTDQQMDRPWTGMDRQDDLPLTDAERQVTGIDRQKTNTARPQTDNARTAAFLATDQTKETSCRLYERMSLHGRHGRPVAHTSSPLQMVQEVYNADLTCHQTIENNMSQMQHYRDRPYA